MIVTKTRVALWLTWFVPFATLALTLGMDSVGAAAITFLAPFATLWAACHIWIASRRAA